LPLEEMAELLLLQTTPTEMLGKVVAPADSEQHQCSSGSGQAEETPEMAAQPHRLLLQVPDSVCSTEQQVLPQQQVALVVLEGLPEFLLRQEDLAVVLVLQVLFLQAESEEPCSLLVRLPQLEEREMLVALGALEVPEQPPQRLLT
jgi:hypothetical protein